MAPVTMQCIKKILVYFTIVLKSSKQCSDAAVDAFRGEFRIHLPSDVANIYINSLSSTERAL